MVAESTIAQKNRSVDSDTQEVEDLRAQLAAMRADYDRLTEATETVSARLDGAVDQLKFVLSDDPVKKQA